MNNRQSPHRLNRGLPRILRITQIKTTQSNLASFRKNGYYIFFAVISLIPRQRGPLACHHLRLRRRQHGGDVYR